MEGNEIAVLPETPLAPSPQEVINRAQVIANALAPIIEKQELFTIIGKKKHVWVEGWTTMLAMLNVFPTVDFVRRLEREDEIAYEAKVTLKWPNGRATDAEHMCSNRESGKSGWPEYAVKSMAQTRAVGKAARLSFSWIMSLAGYATTPAEEMDDVPQAKPFAAPKTYAPPAPGEKTIQQLVDEVKGWIGLMCNDDPVQVDAMVREFTKWKVKDKDTGAYTGEERSFGIGDLLHIKKIDWAKRIHANVSARYNLFAAK